MTHPLALLLASAVLLCGCASVPKNSQTASGYPEVIIEAPAAKIKPAVIGRMINRGWVLERDSDYLLELSLAPTPGQEFAAALLAGNAYGSSKTIATYTLIAVPSGTRVMCQVTVRSHMAFGQVHSTPVNQAGKNYNVVQEALWEIKKDVEGQEASAPKAPPAQTASSDVKT